MDALDPASVILTLERLQTLVRAYRMHYMRGKPARQALLLAGSAEYLHDASPPASRQGGEVKTLKEPSP